MNQSAPALIVLAGFFLIMSCASRPPAPPEWRYEKDAVNLTFQADPNLNLYNDISHTLQLCVYQLKDPNGFNQRTQTEDGLYSLLACSLFDASVANFRSIIVHPGENISVVMDRAEGAKYIGIAAGYAVMEKDRITRLLEIPLITAAEGGTFSRQQVAKPDAIRLNLRLGPLQIETGAGE